MPCLAIASAVAAELDCRHRPCGVQLRGSDAALYVHMVIVVSTPLVWWQFARLVLQMVTTAEDADEPPLEPQLRDRIEPPAPGRATPQGRAALVGSLCFCLLKDSGAFEIPEILRTLLSNRTLPLTKRTRSCDSHTDGLPEEPEAAASCSCPSMRTHKDANSPACE